MPDYHRFEMLGAERGTLYLGFVNERVGDDDGGRDPACFQGDCVVQTARRARSSIANCGDDDINLLDDLVEKRGLHLPREASLLVEADVGE